MIYGLEKNVKFPLIVLNNGEPNDIKEKYWVTVTDDDTIFVKSMKEDEDLDLNKGTNIIDFNFAWSSKTDVTSVYIFHDGVSVFQLQPGRNPTAEHIAVVAVDAMKTLEKTAVIVNIDGVQDGLCYREEEEWKYYFTKENPFKEPKGASPFYIEASFVSGATAIKVDLMHGDEIVYSITQSTDFHTACIDMMERVEMLNIMGNLADNIPVIIQYINPAKDTTTTTLYKAAPEPDADIVQITELTPKQYEFFVNERDCLHYIVQDSEFGLQDILYQPIIQGHYGDGENKFTGSYELTIKDETFAHILDLLAEAEKKNDGSLDRVLPSTEQQEIANHIHAIIAAQQEVEEYESSL